MNAEKNSTTFLNVCCFDALAESCAHFTFHGKVTACVVNNLQRFMNLLSDFLSAIFFRVANDNK